MGAGQDTGTPIAAWLGVQGWKRRRMREFFPEAIAAPFLQDPARALAAARRRRGAVGVWAGREPSGFAAAAAAAGVPVVRIEDGFLRSVGLGADFLPGFSVVADRRGIYFDPTDESDLEHILQTTDFAAPLLARARALRGLIAERGLTKYNLADAPAALPPAQGRRRLFVPGQVEDDRSVLLAGAGIASNLELLSQVRASAPEAFIVYKPHPDVEAGHRVGAISDAEALRFADQVVRGVSTPALIDQVDEVHTLTSLVGFEALLRGRPVSVYGQPFYAGWGLTADRAPLPRRARRLSLDQLVAGTLILYPLYLDPVGRRRCEPEVLVDRLGQPELWRPGLLVRARRLQGRLAAHFRRARPDSR